MVEDSTPNMVFPAQVSLEETSPGMCSLSIRNAPYTLLLAATFATHSNTHVSSSLNHHITSE